MIKRIIILNCIILFSCGLAFSQLAADTLNKTDTTGKKQGYWIKKYDNGKQKYQGRFKNDKPVGEFKYYYEDGSLKAVSIFKDKGIRSFTKTYFPNGKIMSEGFYLNEKKDSAWKYYDGFDVVIREEFYRKNQKNGEWKTYYPDGSLTDKTTWKNGIKDGPWEQNYSGGTLKTQFKNNKLEGLYQVYNPDGKLRNQGKYKNNLKDGTWFWYDSNGLPNKKFVYKEDKLISQELVIYLNNKPINIKFENIAYIYIKNGITYLKKSDNSTLQPNEKLNNLTDLLGIDNFILINKNFLANLDAIKNIIPFAEKFYIVELTPPSDFEVISEEESSIALKGIFNNNK